MALQYVGEKVTVATMIDKYLPTSSDWYWWESKFYGPDPNAYFLGNPRSKNSYGCFAPVIRQTLISYLGSEERVVDTSGTDLSLLCEQYIDHGLPVIVWASSNMAALKKGKSWILPDGTTFTWPSGEHCLLLVGYDDTHYYFNDPNKGAMVAYARTVTEQRYKALGKQSLVVTK